MIAGNHKPRLRSLDEAMRRRFHLIPFAVTIPEADRDKDLSEKLKPEWPAILRWMVDGCLKWQEIGLSPPQAVIDATAAYLETEDTIATWIEERCECGKSYRDSSGNLYASWKSWAELNGEFVGSQSLSRKSSKLATASEKQKSATERHADIAESGSLKPSSRRARTRMISRPANDCTQGWAGGRIRTPVSNCPSRVRGSRYSENASQSVPHKASFTQIRSISMTPCRDVTRSGLRQGE